MREQRLTMTRQFETSPTARTRRSLRRALWLAALVVLSGASCMHAGGPADLYARTGERAGTTVCLWRLDREVGQCYEQSAYAEPIADVLGQLSVGDCVRLTLAQSRLEDIEQVSCDTAEGNKSVGADAPFGTTPTARA